MEDEPKEYCVRRGKKYLTGHGYATGKGYTFSWADDIRSARRMDYGTADSLASNSRGKIVDAPPKPKPFS